MKSSKNIKKRSSSIELLRIISMLFIIMSHSSIHGKFPIELSSIVINNFFLDWITLGNVGVAVFIIISGYFLCIKEDSTKSAKQLHAQVLFYSYMGLFIAFLLHEEMSFKQIIVSICPVLFKQYWFFTAYIVFLVFTPYVNIFINNINKKQHFLCLSIMFVLWTIIPTFTSRNMYGVELPTFLMFYMIGAFLRKYPNQIIFSTKNSLLLFVISLTFLFLSNVVFYYIGTYIPQILNYTGYFYGRNSLLVVGVSIGLFTLTINYKSFFSKFVNVLGGCTFGVYLIHENIFIREILWNRLFPNYLYYNTEMLFVHIFLSVVIIFIVCTAIEYVRKQFLESSCLKIYMFFYNVISCILLKIKQSIIRYIRTN